MGIIEKAMRARDTAAPEAARSPRPVARNRRSARPAPAPGGVTAEFARLTAAGFLPDPEKDASLIEQLRHLKRPILQNAFGPLKDGVSNVIMVTSARPGAGKSFVSAGLAYALTRERELSVVLADLDNIRATLTKELGLGDQAGFFDAADSDELGLESTLVKTEIPGLRILPTGRPATDSAELLNTERVRHLLRDFAEDDPSRIIILDSPPLLATADAHALLDLADQVILVVEAGVTKLSEMRQIIASIGKDKPLGLVLNKSIGGLSTLYGSDYYAGSAYQR